MNPQNINFGNSPRLARAGQFIPTVYSAYPTAQRTINATPHNSVLHDATGVRAGSWESTLISANRQRMLSNRHNNNSTNRQLQSANVNNNYSHTVDVPAANVQVINNNHVIPTNQPSITTSQHQPPTNLSSNIPVASTNPMPATDAAARSPHVLAQGNADATSNASQNDSNASQNNSNAQDTIDKLRSTCNTQERHLADAYNTINELRHKCDNQEREGCNAYRNFEKISTELKIKKDEINDLNEYIIQLKTNNSTTNHPSQMVERGHDPMSTPSSPANTSRNKNILKSNNTKSTHATSIFISPQSNNISITSPQCRRGNSTSHSSSPKSNGGLSPKPNGASPTPSGNSLTFDDDYSRRTQRMKKTNAEQEDTIENIANFNRKCGERSMSTQATQTSRVDEDTLNRNTEALVSRYRDYNRRKNRQNTMNDNIPSSSSRVNNVVFSYSPISRDQRFRSLTRVLRNTPNRRPWYSLTTSNAHNYSFNAQDYGSSCAPCESGLSNANTNTVVGTSVEDNVLALYEEQKKENDKLKEEIDELKRRNEELEAINFDNEFQISNYQRIASEAREKARRN